MPAPPALTKDQAKDIAALVERMVGCKHWGGEELCDAVRAKEIRDALAALTCSRLNGGEARARKRHATNRKVIAAQDKAKDTSF